MRYLRFSCSKKGPDFLAAWNYPEYGLPIEFSWMVSVCMN